MAFLNKLKKLFSADTQLRNLSKIGGLWMFFDSRCQFCKVQAHVLTRVAKKHDFKTKFISLNGKGIPGIEFVKDNGHVPMLGIKSTPTIVIAIPPKTYVFVSQGITTDEQLEEKILTAFESLSNPLAAGLGSIREQQKHQALKDKKGG